MDVELDELRAVPFVMFREGYDLRDVSLAECHRLGYEPRVAVEGGEMDAVLRLTAAGLGVAIVPEMVVEPGAGLVGVPISRPRLSRTIALARRRDRYLSAAARALSALLTPPNAEPNLGMEPGPSKTDVLSALRG